VVADGLGVDLRAVLDAAALGIGRGEMQAAQPGELAVPKPFTESTCALSNYRKLRA
jgi:hypothetical protein